MIREKLINEFITNHVFPHFREMKNPKPIYFARGLNYNDRVVMISPFDNSLTITHFIWGPVQNMFSLSEEETVIILTRWFRKNFPLLSFDGIILLNYP